MTVIPDRLSVLEDLELGSGAHSSIDQGACVMECVSYIAGESWSDRPECASPTIAAFLRHWNDNLNDRNRQALKQYIPRLVGSKGTPEQEDQRAWMAADWLVHTSLPLWLRAAKMDDQAVAVEALPKVTDRSTWRSCYPTFRTVRDLTWNVRREWREKIREAVKAALASQGPPVAAADADAAADAGAGAVAVAAADAAADAAAGAVADAVEGAPVAAAVAAAVAVAVAVAAAGAVAVAVAAAGADAVDGVPVAAADAAAAAVAGADADAVAVAAAGAVAVAVDGGADDGVARYWRVYNAVKDKLIDFYRPLVAETSQSAMASAHDLIDRMLAVTGS